MVAATSLGKRPLSEPVLDRIAEPGADVEGRCADRTARILEKC
jgi:hypothetical protein